METNRNDKAILMKSKFKEFKIESKTLANQTKARMAVVLDKTIEYKRLKEYELPNNSTIILKVKQSNRKNVLIIASYREWRHPGEEKSKKV